MTSIETMTIFGALPLSLSLLVVTSMTHRASADDGKHLFILSGQSNMRGSLPTTFRECVSKVFGEQNVIVVTVARPSQPIKAWYKKWTPPAGQEPDGKPLGTLYESLIKTVKKATKDQKLASVTYIWMQGEADAGSGWASVYEKSFFGVLDQIKADLNIKETNFVLGRINDHWLPKYGIVDGDAMRKLQVKIGEENDNGDWVNTDDLNTGVNPWGLFEIDGGHFPEAGYRVMGQRFAYKACRLLDPDIELDENVFTEVFFDSASDIVSHFAVGKKISGSKPDQKRGAGNMDLGTLLDGKYAGTDSKDEAWLDFAPSKESFEFVIDLGKSETITGVAANILFDSSAAAKLPESILIEISEDGKNYSSVNRKGPYKIFYGRKQREMKTKELKPQPFLILADLTKRSARSTEKKARYIKVTVKSGESRLFIDEIVVNPVLAKQ